MVRALGAFADRVQLQFVKQPARARETVRRRQRDAQPFGQTRTRFEFSRCHFSKTFSREFRKSTLIEFLIRDNSRNSRQTLPFICVPNFS
jgi:hypothetical protein